MITVGAVARESEHVRVHDLVRLRARARVRVRVRVGVGVRVRVAVGVRVRVRVRLRLRVSVHDLGVRGAEAFGLVRLERLQERQLVEPGQG